MGILIAVPNLLFLASIVYAYFSGHEKAPALVLGPVLLSLGMTIVFLLGRRWKNAGLAAIPWVYFGLVVGFAKLGWIDPMFFIGFR